MSELLVSQTWTRSLYTTTRIVILRSNSERRNSYDTSGLGRSHWPLATGTGSGECVRNFCCRDIYSHDPFWQLKGG